MREIVIIVLCDDVIVPTAIEARSKGQLDSHKQVSFVWEGTHSVDTAR